MNDNMAMPFLYLLALFKGASAGLCSGVLRWAKMTFHAR